MRAPVSAVLVLLSSIVSACSSPTEKKEPDVITITNLMAEGADTLNPLLIWEGNDGSRFEVTGWRIANGIGLGRNSPPYENFTWRFLRPDGDPFSGIWDMDLTFFEIRNGILTITYAGTGETMIVSPSGDPGCPEYRKRLPSAQVWRTGRPRDDDPPLPEGIVLPSPMPEVVFRVSFNPCYG